MVLVKRPRCPFCHEEVLATDPKRACESCMGWHHRECWAEGGDRCNACGAVLEPRAGEGDLTRLLESPPRSESPLQRPGCCADRPCPRHAVLASVLITLAAAPIAKIAHKAGLKLVADCSAATGREVLRAIDVELELVLRALSKAQLLEASEKLGLPTDGAKASLQERLLARSLLIRVIHSLPLVRLRELAHALGVDLTDRRWAERVRRDLLLAPLDLRRVLDALNRDDLASLCRRVGLATSGKKTLLRQRLVESAQLS